MVSFPSSSVSWRLHSSIPGSGEVQTYFTHVMISVECTSVGINARRLLHSPERAPWNKKGEYEIMPWLSVSSVVIHHYCARIPIILWQDGLQAHCGFNTPGFSLKVCKKNWLGINLEPGEQAGLRGAELQTAARLCKHPGASTLCPSFPCPRGEEEEAGARVVWTVTRHYCRRLARSLPLFSPLCLPVLPCGGGPACSCCAELALRKARAEEEASCALSRRSPRKWLQGLPPLSAMLGVAAGMTNR